MASVSKKDGKAFLCESHSLLNVLVSQLPYQASYVQISLAAEIWGFHKLYGERACSFPLSLINRGGQENRARLRVVVVTIFLELLLYQSSRANGIPGSKIESGKRKEVPSTPFFVY
jgi:hypothetical protein